VARLGSDAGRQLRSLDWWFRYAPELHLHRAGRLVRASRFLTFEWPTHAWISRATSLLLCCRTLTTLTQRLSSTEPPQRTWAPTFRPVSLLTALQFYLRRSHLAINRNLRCPLALLTSFGAHASQHAKRQRPLCGDCADPQPTTPEARWVIHAPLVCRWTGSTAQSLPPSCTTRRSVVQPGRRHGRLLALRSGA
jgi:hypothetical protein